MSETDSFCRYATTALGTMGGIFLGSTAAFIGFSLRSDIKIIPPTNTLKTLFQYNSSIAAPVNESIGASLAEQWEQYAKYNGLINERGEPIVTLHCEAEDNPASPQPLP